MENEHTLSELETKLMCELNNIVMRSQSLLEFENDVSKSIKKCRKDAFKNILKSVLFLEENMPSEWFEFGKSPKDDKQYKEAREERERIKTHNTAIKQLEEKIKFQNVIINTLEENMKTYKQDSEILRKLKVSVLDLVKKDY
jgi:hypothetical protein